MLKGKVIGIKIDGDYYPCEISSTLDINTELISISSKEKGNWEDFANGKKSYNLSLEGRINNYKTINSAFNKIVDKVVNGNNEFDFVFQVKTDTTSNKFWRFWGRVKSSQLNINAPSQGYAIANYTFQGCGKLNFEATAYEDVINAMPYYEEKDLVIKT